MTEQLSWSRTAETRPGGFCVISSRWLESAEFAWEELLCDYVN